MTATPLRHGAVAFTLMTMACASTVTTPHTPKGPLAGAHLARSIDATMAEVYPPDAPGAAILVVRGSQVVVRKAYGLANVELGVPLRPEHVFALASLSKQFTAAAILKLAEEGRLSLDDDIGKFLPGYPTHGERVTVEHLLTHTSGLSALSETSDLRAVATQDSPLVDVLADWVKDLPKDAAPDEQWAYSNWGYSLLGSIVERASGETYANYLQQRLFTPAGMTHTHYNDRRRIIPFRAAGYEQQSGAPVNIQAPRSRMFLPGGAAAILSTVDDLGRWDTALAEGRVLSKASLDRMFTSFRLKGGAATNYGYGWDLGSYEGRRVQEHAGGTTGFLSYMVRMPDDRVFVAILSNRSYSSIPIQTLAHRIAAMTVGRPIRDPVPVAISPDEIDRVVGTYRGSDVGTMTVTREAETAYVQVPGLGKLALVPIGPHTFRTSTVLWSFSFEPGPDGRAVRVRVKDWKLDDLAERISPAVPAPRPHVVLAPAQLDACTGEYESLNGVLVRVERTGDHLRVTPTAQTGVEVFPVSATEFETADGGTQYRFDLGESGRVTRYLRSAPGGRPVPARRIGG